MILDKVAFSTFAIAASALAMSTPALADPQSMAPNYPVQIEDAFVVPYGDIQVQGDQLYTRNPGPGAHGYTDAPEFVLKAGPVKGLQVDLSAPYTFGSAKTPDNGLVTADALQFQP